MPKTWSIIVLMRLNFLSPLGIGNNCSRRFGEGVIMWTASLRVSAGLCAVLFASLAHGLPDSPRSPGDCRPREWISTVDGQAHQAQRRQVRQESDRRGKQCFSLSFGSRAYHQCYDELSRWNRAIFAELDAQRRQSEAAYDRELQRCEQRAVAQALQESRDQAARNAQTQRDLQGLAQLRESERRAMEAARTREQERQASREPRVIAEATDAPYGASTRNAPRVVETPDYRAQQAAAAMQQQADAQRAYSEALRGVAGSMVDGMLRGAAAQTAVGAEVQAAAAARASPLAAALSSGAIAAAGGRTAETIAQVEALKRDMDRVNGDAFSGDSGGQPRRRVMVTPNYAATPSATAPPRSPQEACQSSPADRLAGCIAEQCAKPGFSEHAQCRPSAASAASAAASGAKP